MKASKAQAVQTGSSGSSPSNAAGYEAIDVLPDDEEVRVSPGLLQVL
jgi:hypothetical protein